MTINIRNIVKVLLFLPIFAVLFVGLNTLTSNAQGLELISADTKLNGRSDAAEIAVHAEFKNTTDNPIKVLCKMTVNNLVGSDEKDGFGTYLGHAATFCWGDLNDKVNPGLCYLATRQELVASFNLTIPAKSNSNPNWFKGYLYPNGYEGMSSVCYTFYNEDNVNESVTFCVDFNVTVTSVETDLKGQIKLYPNPTNTQINVEVIDGQMPNNISVYNTAGEIVITKSITSAADLKIETINLPNGKYFYTLNGGKLDSTSIQFVVNK